MPIEALRASPAIARSVSRPKLSVDYGSIVNASFALFVFCGSVAIIEPSPYDFASLLAIPVWFLGGFKVHRTFLPLLALMFFYNLGGFIGLIPYIVEPEPTSMRSS